MTAPRTKLYEGALAFLNDFGGDREDEYRQAAWLRSDFFASEWSGHLEEVGFFTINFKVSLSDGLELTHPKHASLLDAIKCWLCVQTHPDATGSRRHSTDSTYNRLTATLHLIDYFLIHAERLGILEHGLRILTREDLSRAFAAIASSSKISTSIYEWPRRLVEFLTQKISENPDELDRIVDDHPFLSESIPDPSERMLDLDDLQVSRSRAWLYVNGFYNKGAQGEFHLVPRTRFLAKTIYTHTLWGGTSKPIPLELCMRPRDFSAREFTGVRVTSDADERCGIRKLDGYLRALRPLGLLDEIGVEVPISALQDFDSRCYHSLDLKQNGRFRTLPSAVVFPGL